VTFPESGGNVELTGILKVQVHYYEDGNVQLVSSKDIKTPISFNVSYGVGISLSVNDEI